MRRTVEFLGKRFSVAVNRRPGIVTVSVDGDAPEEAAVEPLGRDSYLVRLGEDACRVRLAQDGEDVFIQSEAGDFHLRILDPVEQAAQEAGTKGDVARAPMPGVVVEIFVSPGDFVTKGSALMTVESMKILTVIRAPADGEVAAVHFPRGGAFEKGAVLVSLKDKAGGAP